MKRDRVRVLGILGAVIAAATAAWFFLVRTPAPKVTASSATAGASSGGGAPSPAAKEGSGEDGATRAGIWAWERDREGPLRLDGQVVNDAGEPVDGALVMITTTPAATARTQADGSFHFDKLVGRTFALRARSGGMVGSTRHRLTSTSDPVVIRVGAAAAVAVLVQDDDERPVRGAKISLSDEEPFGALAPTAITDDQGKATLRGVERGWLTLRASAEGFAPQELSSVISGPSPDGKPVVELTLSLHRGVAVSGEVVDELGAPVRDARVSFTTRGGFGEWQRGDAATDERGAFRFASLPPGRYELSAMDGVHASGDAMAVDVAGEPVSALRLAMRAGGVVRGVVVDRGGAPVPFATVRSAPLPESGPRAVWPAARQAITDERGQFELRGLQRVRLQLRAQGEAASSELVEVSLVEAAQREGVKVVLDVEGTISGVVVDGQGEPVAEMPVTCVPDLRAGSLPSALAASYTATSDGSGAFTMRGLPEGTFRLWVERPGADSAYGAEENSKVAKTGAREVRLVMQPLSRIIGKLVTADGQPPALATISLSMKAPIITRDGSFAITSVEPATYSLKVRGPDFSQLVLDDIVVAPGKDTDLGTLKVTRNRRITGVVVDGEQRPVAGAKVRAGRFLMFETGASRGVTRNVDEQMGVNSAITDEKGAFSLGGADPGYATQLAAETASGRSEVVELAPGTGDPPPVTLQLQGFGSIAGTATVNGKPADEMHISVKSRDGKRAPPLFTDPNVDGTYLLDRLPAGTYVLSAQWRGALDPATGEVKVANGQRSKLDLDVKFNNGPALVVQVAPLPDQQVDSAMLALYQGAHSVSNGKDMMRGSRDPVGRSHWSGNQDAEFPDLKPGTFTLCGLPMTMDPKDPGAIQRVFDNLEKLAAYCKPVTVTAGPARQTFTLPLPAMKPLPPPKK